jgi:pimeloyl-ACP methyl ester carboxylesterase
MPSVTTPNGTLHYREIGTSGPGIILVHGAMESASSHLDLAQTLSSKYSYTVYVYDRRGRGTNLTFPDPYSMDTEISDLSALLSHTSTHNIFGISSGALICLQAALKLPDLVRNAVIFEPVLSINGSMDESWVPRWEEEIKDGSIDAALVTQMKGTKMGPAVLHYMPRWLLQWMTRLMLSAEEKKQNSSTQPAGESSEEARPVTMKSLAPAFKADITLVREMKDTLDPFKNVKGKVLLLGGRKSPKYLQLPLPKLEEVIPNAELVWFPDLDHMASGNREFRGSPERVAEAIGKFIGEGE